MRKNWLGKLNYSFLKKKTPLLGFTVLQVFILFLVMSGGGAAVILSRQQQPVTQNTGTTTLPTYYTDTTQTKSTVSQGNTQESSGTPKTTTNTTPKATTNPPDQYGCVPQTSGYDSCVKYAKQNALTLWCGEQGKKASDVYYPESTRAQAAYDAVMAEWNAVKDQPTHSPYDEYATDAKTKYNAIEKPAYATYVSTINSLNAQGCHEILVYSDTSWAGY